MTKVTITYEQLDSKRACEDGLELFKETFPKGISVTSEEELVAIAKKFSKKFAIGWASENLLSGNYYDKYLEVKQPDYDKYLEVEQPAYDKYLEVKQPAWKEYLEVIQQANDKYLEVRHPAWKEYLEVIQPAYDKYLEVRQPAYDKYLEVRAIVFTKLYYEQESAK